MFAYTKSMQLALSDKLRRLGLAAGAGVAIVVALGFLLAALWTFLVYHLLWGALLASLAIGGGLLAIGLILLLLARTERHAVPEPQQLRTEVQQHLNLLANSAIAKASDAAEAALDSASHKASTLMDLAQQKVHSVSDGLGYRADRFAERAEARAYTAARHMGEDAARKLGVTPERIENVTRKLGVAGQSNAATLAPLIGAFAIGITLASRLQSRRHQKDDDETY